MIEIKDAIEISRIIAKAPQERLPLILSVFESADLTIEGLEEIEAWAISQNRSNVIELGEFMEELDSKFHLEANGFAVVATEFAKFCTDRKLDPKNTRRWLARKGVIKTDERCGKTVYTPTRRIEGKTTRCVIVNSDWREKISDTDTGEVSSNGSEETGESCVGGK